MARSAERVPAQERSDEIRAERRWRGARSTCPPRSEATGWERSDDGAERGACGARSARPPRSEATR